MLRGCVSARSIDSSTKPFSRCVVLAACEEKGTTRVVCLGDGSSTGVGLRVQQQLGSMSGEGHAPLGGSGYPWHAPGGPLLPPQSFEMQPPMQPPMQEGADQWTPCPVTVRLEPMPFFVADWQVASHLRSCGEVAAVRFQRNGDGAALCRFHHHSGAANALRWGEILLLGVRVFILPAWCEARYHTYAGHCSSPATMPQGGRQGGGHGGSVTYRNGHNNMPDINGNTGDWCAHARS